MEISRSRFRARAKMNIDWNEHRPHLRRCFFGAERWKLADRGSELERRFFVFLVKLQEQLRRRKRDICKEPPSKPSFNHLGVPVGPFQRYHTSRVAVDVSHKADVDLRNLEDYVMRELIYALACFIAYENKKKLNQLKQLRTSQNNLPIAAHREHIIDVISKNQVLIIAGDTGCGKSTQVCPSLCMNFKVQVRAKERGSRTSFIYSIITIT
uniref:ATP-dependent RNA helicase DHX36 n=1 Tax=Ascaris lumbricoides TaxID=6252 RepID=A0A0M3IJT2_ASCLU